MRLGEETFHTATERRGRVGAGRGRLTSKAGRARNAEVLHLGAA